MYISGLFYPILNFLSLQGHQLLPTIIQRYTYVPSFIEGMLNQTMLSSEEEVYNVVIVQTLDNLFFSTCFTLYKQGSDRLRLMMALCFCSISSLAIVGFLFDDCLIFSAVMVLTMEMKLIPNMNHSNVNAW